MRPPCSLPTAQTDRPWPGRNRPNAQQQTEPRPEAGETRTPDVPAGKTRGGGRFRMARKRIPVHALDDNIFKDETSHEKNKFDINSARLGKPNEAADRKPHHGGGRAGPGPSRTCGRRGSFPGLSPPGHGGAPRPKALSFVVNGF